MEDLPAPGLSLGEDGDPDEGAGNKHQPAPVARRPWGNRHGVDNIFPGADDIGYLHDAIDNPDSPQGFDLFPTGAGTIQTSAPTSLLTSRPLDGFYTHFFPAHPFLLPRFQLTH